MNLAHNTSIAPTAQTVERFLKSKSGSADGGGDRIVAGSRYIGVVDAATDKSGLKWSLNNREVSGEYALAEVLSRALNTSSDDIEVVLERVQREMSILAESLGVNLTEGAASPLASFVLLDITRGDLVVLGDCAYGFVNGDQVNATYNSKRVDELASETRALAYLAWTASGGASNKNEDPGRAAILDDLREATRLANADMNSFRPDEKLYGHDMSSLVYPVFDIIIPRAVSRVQIPTNINEVILASDGYPRIFKSLEETENYLKRSLQEDPLRIGEHPSTKGLVAGQESFDDRAYIRVSIPRVIIK